VCGIAGLLHLGGERPAEEPLVRSMLAALVHRGPDEEGVHIDGPVGLGTRRLMVIDRSGGHQPLSNEDGSVWVSYNGEIFNYRELAASLASRGHRFAGRCDTEVLVHLYEEVGERLVDQLNGQFAFALWDRRRRLLLLARDRLGIRPLYHVRAGGMFAWASEIKALQALPGVGTEADVHGLAHVFVFAAPGAPRTMLRGVSQLPAGHLIAADASSGTVRQRTWWDLDFAPASEEPPDLGEKHYAAELARLLEESVRMQLVADVPVGVYVSGGLDSSVIAGLVQRAAGDGGRPITTFSIGFEEAFFDELPHARCVARHLGADAHELICRHRDVVAGLPAAVWFTEHPCLITEVVPLMLLSQLASRHVTVILTGEGADEAFGGYAYFRLDKVRRLLSKFPMSILGGVVRWFVKRRIGFDHVFPKRAYVREVESRYGFYPAMQPEFECGRYLLDFLASDGLRERLAGHHPVQDLTYPADRASRWHPFDQATYFAYKVRLANHQISPLGDRATMANSVEGRYPFLDHRLVELATAIPRHHRLRGFTGEKHVLRRALGHLLPDDVARRKKQQFQAPCGSAFLGDHGLEYVREFLSERVIRDKGYFAPGRVAWVISTLERYTRTRPDDVNYERVLAELGLVGVLTTHLWDEMFVRGRGRHPATLASGFSALPWFGLGRDRSQVRAAEGAAAPSGRGQAAR
jgi:asparagine synthase (glutamine-hydrolysing)